MKKLISLIGLTVLAVVGASADTITIVFDNPDQTGSPGDTLQFFGTITNTSSDIDPADAIYLNSDSFSFALSDASYILTDDFFNTPISLTGGESSGDIELFDITLADPVSDPFGSYVGVYGLIGGMDGGDLSAQDNLAQAGFSVDIEPSAPEPATVALFGPGLILLAWLNRRRGHTE